MSSGKKETSLAFRFTTNPAAFLLAATGLIVQVITALVIFGPILVSLNSEALLAVTYTSVVILLGLAGVYWLNSKSSGMIKFGSLLLLCSAVMAVTTIWGYFIGSFLMVTGAIAAVSTIRAELRIPQRHEIVSR